MLWNLSYEQMPLSILYQLFDNIFDKELIVFDNDSYLVTIGCNSVRKKLVNFHKKELQFLFRKRFILDINFLVVIC